jgi:bifunctional non-homologous end joining protein LigD
MSVQSISLAYRDGSSDKVYHAQIEEKDNGYVVNFQYGRRGSTLNSGSKTATPVALAAAQKVYDKLVAEKKGKGYSEGEDGTPYAGSELAGQQSGLIPQLLNAVDEEQVEFLLDSENYFMQEKKDGVRQFVTRAGDQITGGNRKGLIVAVSQSIAAGVLSLRTKRDADFILDGEAIGDVYWPFDVLRYGGQDTTGMPVENRWSSVGGPVGNDILAGDRVPDDGITPETKRALFDKIKSERGEGVVFKKLGSKYVPGRPNSGGNQLKFKFTQSATCFVRAINGSKRSIALGMEAGEGLTGVGNVTIPVNCEIPNEGDLVEVRYLYAFPGGSLFQPVYLGSREGELDKADDISTLKFKQSTTDEDDA